MVMAAGTGTLTTASTQQSNAEEHTAMDLAFQSKQWFAVQLLVTAGDPCSI